MGPGLSQRELLRRLFWRRCLFRGFKWYAVFDQKFSQICGQRIDFFLKIVEALLNVVSLTEHFHFQLNATYLSLQGRAVHPTAEEPHGADRHDWFLYQERNVIERYFGRIKQYRRVATRFDKRPRTPSASSGSPRSTSCSPQSLNLPSFNQHTARTSGSVQTKSNRRQQRNCLIPRYDNTQLTKRKYWLGNTKPRAFIPRQAPPMVNG
jgi:hypothetical protein